MRGVNVNCITDYVDNNWFIQRALEQGRTGYALLLRFLNEGSYLCNIPPMGDGKRFKVALVQMSMGAEPDRNLARGVEMAEEAARGGARVVCLPELFRCPYFCQTEDTARFDLAETVPGPTSEAVGRVARKWGVVVIAPIFERRAPGIYHNSALVIDVDGTIAGVYRKMHIPEDPGYYEKFYFTPGDLGFQAPNTAVGTLGVLLCWDQWYPEAARITALKRAIVLFYPTAIGWHPQEKEEQGSRQFDAWRTVQRGHAISNGLYVAAVNRVGFEPSPGEARGKGSSDSGIEFWGGSFICDPEGVVIAESKSGGEEIVSAEVDTEKIEKVRRSWPFFRDRRIDAYGDLSRLVLEED